MLPPFIPALAILIGLALQRLWPLGFLPEDGGNWFGWLLLVAALSLGGAAAWKMKSAQTHVHVHKPTTLIVGSGPFAYSRNPIYLGMTLVVVAVACISNSLWVLLLAAPTAFAIQKFAIEPEERYLEGKFGRDYLDYKARVRRWL
jgi:protein-S-isoprenylcysteine O-methyltransferase Ste14